MSSSTPTSTLNQNGDFTTQAALSLTRATQTGNIVNSKAYYDISFRTATSRIVKTIEMDFPTGTYVGSALLVETTGIGPGTVAASAGEVLTYTVSNAVNIPANTKIRIQVSNINNPQDAGNYMVTITTRNTANAIIDGPTATTAYNIKQIATADLADSSITTPKIADGSVTTSKLAFDVDPPRTATLIVKKAIVNNVGPPFPTASDFLIDVNGDNPSPTRFPGSASGVTVFLAPGPYAVTEDRIPQDGFGPYFTTYSQDCVGTISDGESKECIVTNTRQ
jgi:hypothetical protein